MSFVIAPLFDPSVLQNNAFIVIIGKRTTGKTLAVRDILKNHFKNLTGVIVNPSEENEHAYTDFQNVHTEVSPDLLERFRKTDEPGYLVLDNCFSQELLYLNNGSLRNILLNRKSLCILTMALPMNVPRTKADYVFLFKENVLSNRKRMYEAYASFIPSFDTFNNILEECTAEPYTCLVLDYKSSEPWENRIFKWKAMA